MRGGVDNTELAYRVEGVGGKIEGAAKYTVVCRPGTIGLVCPHFILLSVSSIVGMRRCQRSVGKVMWQVAREEVT
jgi:hypothetical protein